MLRKLLVTLLLFTLVSSEIPSLDKIEISLRRGLDEYISTGRKSEELTEVLKHLKFPELFRRTYKKDSINGLICTTCNVGASAIIKARRLGASKEVLVDVAIKLCVWFKIEPEFVCEATIKRQADTLFYIADNSPELTSNRFCSIFFQGNGCKDSKREEWTIEIPPKPLFSYKTQNVSKARPLKVLQITDIHYDPNYTLGSNAACDAPLCCQAGTKPLKPEDSAGMWGDYRGCDTSWNLTIASLEHIIATHKHLDYFYYTGDIVDHNVWETDISRNTEVITKVLRVFKTYFSSIPVFPILGNHEPHPVNLFSSDGVNNVSISTQWVFDVSAEEWKDWLPPETRDTILKGGYYTVLVRPGFRIIALNSNVCFTFNWWLVYDDVDPYDQLVWLVQVLLEAERNNETVHILSHVPSGDDTCLQNWGREYARIVNRFSDIIAAQFNGHTHKDENVIYFDHANPHRAISVAFNGASLTPYHDANPNYVIYHVDSQTYEVLDYDMWIFNLTDANLTPNQVPTWYKLYSFKSAYGVDSLKPNAMAKLARDIAGNRSLAEQYFRYKFRDGDAALQKGCDDKCHLSNICYMVTSYHGQTLHCDYLTEIWNSTENINMK
ncbi:hypothetical protein ILUMI_27406 [Ignelater luminosus]|uniref:Sphingomyelin phosphodiesterase n=1 Tax=Ignelater luminosus TaxID=2038154 RepID=A0A8K0C375_IGNLU|nr:hypothetical protein ILUMI_27406 [Ignelater luminosus]